MKDFFKKSKIEADYRKEAKRICDMHVNKLAIIYLVYFAIIFAVAIIENLLFGDNTEFNLSINIMGTASWNGGWISLIFVGPFIFSLAYISKNVFEDIEPKIEDLFEGFKNFTKSFVIYILQMVFIILWALLLIIPGIIKIFAYSMSYYVAIDNPNLTARECIKESQRIMKGHKWELFCLHFSYIGWLFLSLFTLGILLLWVAPRIEQATYLFYLDVSGRGLKS